MGVSQKRLFLFADPTLTFEELRRMRAMPIAREAGALIAEEGRS